MPGDVVHPGGDVGESRYKSPGVYLPRVASLKYCNPWTASHTDQEHSRRKGLLHTCEGLTAGIEMTSLLMVAALLGVGMAATLGVGDEACRGVGGTAWVADKSDCAKFFLCVEGKAHAFNCGVNVWDQNTKTCVEKGSRFDSCTSEGILENLGKPCSNGEEFSPKSDNCAQYYECSATSPLFRGEDPRLRECKYPFLWSTETKRCEYYTDVECGARKELVDPCEYRRYQCDFSHCIPCNIRFASCRGKPDGLNAWLGKESSPFFTVCSGSRVVYSGQCEQAGGVYLFDPVKRTCVEVKGNGGM